MIFDGDHHVLEAIKGVLLQLQPLLPELGFTVRVLLIGVSRSEAFTALMSHSSFAIGWNSPNWRHMPLQIKKGYYGMVAVIVVLIKHLLSFLLHHTSSHVQTHPGILGSRHRPATTPGLSSSLSSFRALGPTSCSPCMLPLQPSDPDELHSSIRARSLCPTLHFPHTIVSLRWAECVFFSRALWSH